jgi:glycine oxidase
MHTVIIGNGILGLTTAFRLALKAQAADVVTIIGRRSREGSATLAAGAMLNLFAEVEQGSLENEIDLFRFELGHLASKMWPKFEAELIDAAGAHLPNGCRDCQGYCRGGCANRGTFVINNTSADNLDDENFDAILQTLKLFDEPHRLVSPRDIPNYSPEQQHRATRALYIEDEGWFNPRLIVEKLDQILSRHPQVRIIDDNAVSLNKGIRGIESTTLESGVTIDGDTFVVANGASASDLIERSKLGINIQRIFYGIGTSVEIRSQEFPHKNCIRTPNRGMACGIYSVPYFSDSNQPLNHILLGASNFISPTPHHHSRLSSVESIISAGISQINRYWYRADLIRVNIGWRPTSQDTYPLIGRTSINNLIVATGTKRDGFHMSPLISEYVSKLVRNEPVDDRYEVFAPERKMIKALTREQAVSRSVKHLLSAAYQHGFSPSRSRMPEQITQMYKDAIEKLHDQVGAIDWGIPTEMLDMYRYGHARST